MFVERHGRGPEAFFALHGWGGDRRTFTPLAPHVPEWASLYAADLPGCGDSPRPDAWAVGCVLDEIVRAVRETAAERLTLVGNCGGAVFALLAARENFPAGFVGAAIVLFFALLALAHGLPYVALVGFALVTALRAAPPRSRTPPA